MAKVLVERPRPGSRDGSRPSNGYRKRVSKGMAHPDGPPARERMTARYNWTRPFNEHLGPLRRFVQSRIGRPWDKVHAEMSAHIDRGNVVQKHILTHLSDYLLTRVILVDGVPCYAETAFGSRSWYGRPLRDLPLRQIAYVCPKTSLLRRMPPRWKKPPSRTPTPPAYVPVSKTLQCRFIDGNWELVTLAPLPDAWHRANCPATDVVLRRPVRDLTEAEARRHHGAAVYAVSRRVLRKRELRNNPIPIDFIR